MPIALCNVVFLLLGAAPPIGQLPPEILVDQYLMSADRLMAQKDTDGALKEISKIVELKQEHGLTLPNEFYFKHAQVAFAAGSFQPAIDLANQYLTVSGQEGKFYREALTLLLDIKDTMQVANERITCAGQKEGAPCWMQLDNQPGCYFWNPAVQPHTIATWTADCVKGLAEGTGKLTLAWDLEPDPQEETREPEEKEASSTNSDTSRAPEVRVGQSSTFRGGPTCAGQEKGASCWMEVANQPGCNVWNPNLQPDESATWTGECVGGVVQGTGTLKWVWDAGEKSRESTGPYVEGKQHGQWAVPYGDGNVGEGPYVEGKLHGHWVLRESDGDVSEGPFVENKRHGSWVLRRADGTVYGGPYEAGRKHGHWVEPSWWSKDDKSEGPYVQGERHGQWVGRDKNGDVEERFYLRGELVGRTAEPLAMEGRLEDGLYEGPWAIRRNQIEGYDLIAVEESGPFKKGERHGQWVVREEDGTVLRGAYVDGKKQGRWIETYRDGENILREGPYVAGKKHGLWLMRWANSDEPRAKEPHRNGKRHGQWIEYEPDGSIYLKGNYVEGEKQGYWVDNSYTRAVGMHWGRGNGNYADGNRDGDWVLHGSDGAEARGSFMKGEPHGDWIISRKGARIKLTYTNGKIEPPRPDMAVIPGGSFRMGCVSGRDCEDDEKPVHEVRVEAFELGKYEVTFEEYDRFTIVTGREPADDEGWGRGRRPVINVSWSDAVAYTQWLSEETGEPYRLPSEAEWEYATRAGSETRYSWGRKRGRNRANCDGCGSQWDEEQTAPVGSFAPNGWGLHDMHGNVWEWVQDCWNENYQGAPADGAAWETGECSQRVLRGGSWGSGPRLLRSANRGRSAATGRDLFSGVGFRVARTITP